MAEKLESRTVGKLLAAFLMVIVGLSLITVVASNTNDVSKVSTSTETLNVAAAKIPSVPDGNLNATYYFTTLYGCGYHGWRADNTECKPTVLAWKNNTGSLFTVTTDYVVDGTCATGAGTAGTFIHLVNSSTAMLATNSSNVTSITYTYCADDYLASGFGRNAIDLVAGLFAIALLLGAVGLCYSVFKDLGFD